MQTKAVEKLQTEMAGNKTDSYIQVVGDFLLQNLRQNPQDAEKILRKDKTIAKSLEEMSKVAEKKKVGSCAVLTDQEGFEIVLKYFEIEAKPSVTVTKHTETAIKGPKSRANGSGITDEIDFDVKLEDFLV